MGEDEIPEGKLSSSSDYNFGVEEEEEEEEGEVAVLEMIK